MSVYGANLVVVGVGGAGGNALLSMAAGNVRGVRRVVANTDAQAVVHVEHGAEARGLPLGPKLTRGLGAGGRPQVGANAAAESQREITNELRGADLVFVTAGMGGGTGTGAAPLIAATAKELGALVVGVVTRPFAFEGRKRNRYADQGLEALAPHVDSLLVVPNDRLLEGEGGDLGIEDAFRLADSVLCDAVRGISALVTEGGVINLDLADLREVLHDGGRAVVGMGEARLSEGGALEAVRRAMDCPLLDDASLDGAGALLLNISSGPDLGLRDAHAAASLLQSAAHDDAELAFGIVTDADMVDRVRVTIVATRFAEVVQEAPPRRFPRNALVMLDPGLR